jgi:hypothetical protein
MEQNCFLPVPVPVPLAVLLEWLLPEDATFHRAHCFSNDNFFHIAFLALGCSFPQSIIFLALNEFKFFDSESLLPKMFFSFIKKNNFCYKFPF